MQLFASLERLPYYGLNHKSIRKFLQEKKTPSKQRDVKQLETVQTANYCSIVLKYITSIQKLLSPMKLSFLLKYNYFNRELDNVIHET